MRNPSEQLPGADLPRPLNWEGAPVSVVFDEESAGTDVSKARILGGVYETHPGGLQISLWFTPAENDSYRCGATIGITPQAENDRERRRIKAQFGGLTKKLQPDYSFPGYQGPQDLCLRRRASGQDFSVRYRDLEETDQVTPIGAIEVSAVNTEAANKDLGAVLSASSRPVEETVVELARLTAIVANNLVSGTPRREEAVLRITIPSRISEEDSGLIEGSTSKELVPIAALTSAYEGFPSVEDLGGLEPQIEAIEDWIGDFMASPELRHKYEIEKPGALLLEGVPGTGKTSLVRAMAKKYGFILEEVSVTDILDAYVGVTQAKLRRLYDAANNKSKDQPVLLFFDEFDGLFSPGAGGNSGVASSLISEFKTILTSQAYPNVLTIAAANSVARVDPALLRPGRFDRSIQFTTPGEIARQRVWETLLNKRPGLFAIMGDDLLSDASGSRLWTMYVLKTSQNIAKVWYQPICTP